MERRDFLKIIGMAPEFLVSVKCSKTSSQAEKPNIIILVADDLGWNDVSYHGSIIQTPNIDRIASEGRELDRFYTCPVCSPTRAGLLTGRYPIRYGLMRSVITPWNKYGLPCDEVMLPEILVRAGYRYRGIFGKWHLGHYNIKYHPLRRGFTHFYGHYNGAIDYFSHKRESELDWHNGYETSYDQGYSTKLITRAAVRFIEKYVVKGPFFCYVPFNAPHSPYQAPPEYLNRYAHLRDQGKSEIRQKFAAMVSCLDDGIGQILDALDRTRTAENTMIIFFSDNGGNGRAGSNSPLRGRKGTVFEGGIRVPAAIRWPERIREYEKISTVFTYLDALPTILHAAGIEYSSAKPLDGIDMYDILMGKKVSVKRDLFSYVGLKGENEEYISITTPIWKFVCAGTNVIKENADRLQRKSFLFRIDQDPLEKQNLINDFPEVANEMLQRVKDFRALQPELGVTPFYEGREGFRAPEEWKITEASISNNSNDP